MKVTTALVEVFITLIQQQEQNTTQLETEKQKQRKGGNEKMEFLIKKKKDIEDKMEEVRGMTNYFFKSVFVHRYRDVLPDIRSICIAELGCWMTSCSPVFLEDTYLKYIGWTLHDKVPEVRLKCLQALLPLYEDASLVPRLELFTNKFKDRLVSMVLDKDIEVAVVGVKLVTLILKAFPKNEERDEEIINSKDCETVFDLVFASHRGLALAAGDFLSAKLFFVPDESVVQHLKTKKGKQRSVNTPLIRDLIRFFVDSTLHKHAAYLVDALIDTNDMLKDWECMTDLLLEEPGKNEEPLNDNEENALIDIMVCAVKEAATTEYPVARASHKKYMTLKEREYLKEEKSKITEHFIVALPQLLQKFIADAEKIANLLNIPKYFDLDTYTTGRLEKQLDLLLKLMEDIMEKHTDDEVLLGVSSVYEVFLEEGLAIQSRCEKAKSKLIDSIVLKFKRSVEQFHEEDQMDDEDMASLVASMKKLTAFYDCHDLAKWDLWDTILGMLQPQDDDSKYMPAALKSKGLRCLYLNLSFDLFKISEEQQPSQESIDRLVERRSVFINCCEQFMLDSGAGKTAYMALADTLILFGWRLKERKEHLAPLVVDVDTALDERLSRFCQDKVFLDEDASSIVNEEDNIEGLYLRRKMLAAYCKLVLFGVLHIKSAADVFKQYVKYFNDFGDIIKQLMSKCRELNKIDSAKAVVLALTNMFVDLQDSSEGGKVDPYSDGFMEIRDLAKRFALTFGPDPLRNREAVATIHRDGILLALKSGEGRNENEPPKNVAFLEILMEFTNKLMKQDKKAVLNYLDKHIGNSRGDNEEWQPLLLYRNSLSQGEDGGPGPTAPPTGAGPGRRGRKRAAGTPTPSEMGD